MLRSAVVASVCLAAFTVSLAGCSGSGSGDQHPSDAASDSKVETAIKAGAWDQIRGEAPKDVESVESYVKRPEFDSTVKPPKDYAVVGLAHDDEDFDCRLSLHPDGAAEVREECFYAGYWDEHEVMKGVKLGSSVPTTSEATSKQVKALFGDSDDSSFYVTPKAPVRVGDWIVYAGEDHEITFWNTETGHGVFQRLGIEKQDKVELLTF